MNRRGFLGGVGVLALWPSLNAKEERIDYRKREGPLGWRLPSGERIPDDIFETWRDEHGKYVIRGPRPTIRCPKCLNFVSPVGGPVQTRDKCCYCGFEGIYWVKEVGVEEYSKFKERLGLPGEE